MELPIIRFAADRADDDARAEIADVAQRFRAGIGLAEFRRLDRRFHATIARACGNPLLVEVYSKVLARLFESDEFDRLLTSTRNRPRYAASSTPRPATTPPSPRRSPQGTPTTPSARAPAISMPSNAASSTASCREEPMITGMNHAVLYVRDARAQQRFYADVLGFTTVVGDDDGRFAFMRAPASENHHDIAFFSIGAGAGAVDGGADECRPLPPRLAGGDDRGAGHDPRATAGGRGARRGVRPRSEQELVCR